MITLVVTACPAGLRGDLTKWLLEISPGVFVGNVSARVRDSLWERTVGLCKDGRALMIFNAPNEQGYDYRVHLHSWEPVDMDGLTLMKRPNAREDYQRARTGWSKARAYRRAIRR
ncbi:type I-E CRISPR-associated endoribonuclease Cas2e [Schaalia sp. lx-100]|uniref:type I-E CRISPR-associated endoribonuclease Cas2e n=1 Tax=Schaalia sp. lx-100 TaxID=2899081 RepID=UPI001E52CB74|nr:type I-E CRISPR-associated endoribonuclease Cas2e [Schaalia sp. lx-100]MCD4556953.1 type I-E CRISPR-associated endoribonuclease Cas2e [Schaalia sp. lx-100]